MPSCSRFLGEVTRPYVQTVQVPERINLFFFLSGISFVTKPILDTGLCLWLLVCYFVELSFGQLFVEE